MRKAFAIIFFILFIIIFPWTLFSFNLKQTILSPTFYKQTFRKIDIYNRISKIDPQKVADYIKSVQTEGSAEDVNSGQIGDLLTYISPQDLQYTFEKNIDAYLASSAKGQKDFAVDLSAIKKSISAKNPDAQTKDLLSQIPDSYSPPQTTAKLNKYVPYLPVSKILSYFGFGFSIFCLLMSFVLWPGWKGKLRMSGTIFIIFGAIILIGNLIVRPFPVPANFVAEFLNGIAHDLTIIAKNQLLRLYLIEGLSMVGAGIIFWIVSFFIPSAVVAKEITEQKPAIRK